MAGISTPALLAAVAVGLAALQPWLHRANTLVADHAVRWSPGRSPPRCSCQPIRSLDSISCALRAGRPRGERVGAGPCPARAHHAARRYPRPRHAGPRHDERLPPFDKLWLGRLPHPVGGALEMLSEGAPLTPIDEQHLEQFCWHITLPDPSDTRLTIGLERDEEALLPATAEPGPATLGATLVRGDEDAFAGLVNGLTRCLGVLPVRPPRDHGPPVGHQNLSKTQSQKPMLNM